MRLNPIALRVSKQLVPIYDKSMIYYSLSTFMLAGIQDVPAITIPHDAPSFHRPLGGSPQLGVNLSCTVQQEPNGLAQAFVLGIDFIGDDNAVLALSNNVFYGLGIGTQLRRHTGPDGDVVYAHQVADPTAYGMIEFDESFKAIPIGEKSVQPCSNHVASGLHFYDNDVVEIAKDLQLSIRGEYEVTDVNHTHLGTGRLTVEVLSRDTAWPGTDTFGSLADAASFIRIVQHRQGFNIGTPEEAARRMGPIDDKGLRQRAEPLVKSEYGAYFLGLSDNQQS